MDYKRYSPLSIEGLADNIACFYDHEERCFDFALAGSRPQGHHYRGLLGSWRHVDDDACREINRLAKIWKVRGVSWPIIIYGDGA